MGESLWEFESPLRHHSSHAVPLPRQARKTDSLGRKELDVPDAPGSRDLDLAVLSHLRGYPEEPRRFSNLMKQAHQGRSAAEFFLTRPVEDNSFVAALVRLIQAGEDVVTVVEAAELLGSSPSALLDPARLSELPPSLAGEERHRIWCRADITARRKDPGRRTGA